MNNYIVPMISEYHTKLISEEILQQKLEEISETVGEAQNYQ